jgi:hypothetical protein
MLAFLHSVVGGPNNLLAAQEGFLWHFIKVRKGRPRRPRQPTFGQF